MQPITLHHSTRWRCSRVCCCSCCNMSHKLRPQLTTRSPNLTPTNRNFLVNFKLGHTSKGGMWLYELHHHGNKVSSALLCIQGISWLQFHVLPCPALFTDLWNLQHANRLEITVTPVALSFAILQSNKEGKIIRFNMDCFPSLRLLESIFWNTLKF